MDCWNITLHLYPARSPPTPANLIPPFPFLLLIFQALPSRVPPFSVLSHMSDTGTHTQWSHCCTISPAVCSRVCCCEIGSQHLWIKPECLKPEERNQIKWLMKRQHSTANIYTQTHKHRAKTTSHSPQQLYYTHTWAWIKHKEEINLFIFFFWFWASICKTCPTYFIREFSISTLIKNKTKTTTDLMQISLAKDNHMCLILNIC